MGKNGLNYLWAGILAIAALPSVSFAKGSDISSYRCSRWRIAEHAKMSDGSSVKVFESEPPAKVCDNLRMAGQRVSCHNLTARFSFANSGSGSLSFYENGMAIRTIKMSPVAPTKFARLGSYVYQGSDKNLSFWIATDDESDARVVLKQKNVELAILCKPSL